MTASSHDARRALAAVAIALLSALLFTQTYVLNRAIANDGGHWAWTASLRYLITLPLLLPLMPWQGGIAPVRRALRAHPWTWLHCSAIGFVLFYLLLSYAASSGPSWLVAGSFQFTVIAGMLCAPLLYRHEKAGDARRPIPRAALAVGVLILAGVLLLQRTGGSTAAAGSRWPACSGRRCCIRSATACCCCTWRVAARPSTRPSACSA